jgi:hypothetical protein
MAQATDLYPILKAYANKNGSPYISIEKFIAFLKTYSVHKAPEQPEWNKWAGETGVTFWSEMSSLVESERCVLLTDTADGRIYMPYYYLDQIREAYHSVDDTADVPFPTEESLRITIPADQVRIFKLETELAPFFAGPRDETGMPVSLKNQKGRNDKEHPANTASLPAIVKLIFPESFGSALIPAPLIPKRLMEAALLKVRHYLRTHGNREYALHKLSPSLQGRDKQLREMFDQIAIRPLDCLPAMESFSEFTWFFWAHFCALVKSDVKKKKETLAEDLAAIQAVFVIEICNGFYKSRAVKQREREIAFRALELRMEKPPYHYTIDEVSKFTNDKGVSLLGLYSAEDLDGYIKKRLTESESSGLPDWLVLQGKQGERGYVKKEKLLLLCAKLLVDTRPLMKQEITKRWIKLIRSFKSEAAMEKDADFDILLGSCTAAINPLLMTMLEDPKLLYVYEELERVQKSIPASSRIFKGGKLIPINTLYGVRRKDLLADAKIMLPFWYSVPILTAIAAFFSRLNRKRKEKKQSEEAVETGGETAAEDEESKDIQNIARDIAKRMVPQGQDLDDYLENLESRWSRLLNKQARQNLIEDVNSLVRDNLRHSIRIHKRKKISPEGLNELAADLLVRSPALQSLGAQDSLRLYMELYMVKLLLTFKM